MTDQPTTSSSGDMTSDDRRRQNLAAVEAAFRGVGNADAVEQMRQYTEDLVLELPYTAPPKRVEGKAAALTYLASAFTVFRMQLTVTEVHQCVDPDELIVEFVSTGLVLTTGKSYENQYINVFRFREGKICFQREFFNPNAAAEARIADAPR